MLHVSDNDRDTKETVKLTVEHIPWQKDNHFLTWTFTSLLVIELASHVMPTNCILINCSLMIQASHK